MQRTLATSGRRDNRRHDILPTWFLMTDLDRLADPSQIVAQLPSHSAVIVRDRDPAMAERTASSLLPLCRSLGVLVLISCQRPPLQLHCDGLHIPESAISNWRLTDLQRLRPVLLTTSAHSLRAIHRCQHLGIDAVIVSPVFATKSHPGAQSLGLMRFAGMIRRSTLPVVALGGVRGADTIRIFSSGADGIAGISLFSEPLVTS
jgi:thiamine-phosphate pyrophosphorylase